MHCCYCVPRSPPCSSFPREGSADFAAKLARWLHQMGAASYHFPCCINRMRASDGARFVRPAVVMIKKWIKIESRPARRNLSWTDGVIAAMINRYTGPRRRGTSPIELAIFTLSTDRLPQPFRSRSRAWSFSVLFHSIYTGTCEAMLYHHHYHYLRLKLKWRRSQIHIERRCCTYEFECKLHMPPKKD